MADKPCTCGLCRPIEGHRYHPVYGFDLDQVAGVHCLTCNEPIGDEPYVLEAGVARFGTMQFLHERCAGPKQAEKNRRIEERAIRNRSKRTDKPNG